MNREDITRSARLLEPHIRRTPIIRVWADEMGLSRFRLDLKLELMQHAGSFKTRGAFLNLLTRQIPAAGVVAASGGNHGVAVAYAASALGLPAKIFVPTISSPAKIARMRELGADLVVAGDFYSDSLALSEEWAAETGAMQVHAFDQQETIMGQASLGRELEEQAPDLETVLVGVGGGGLIAGVSAWYQGRVKVVGVEPRLAPTLTRAFEAGGPVDAETGGIAADSLAPKQIGRLVYPIVKEYVSEVLLVEDQDIQYAQSTLWRTLRIVAEPGGATALAALLSRKYEPQPDERVGVVLSGGNTVAVNFS